MYEHERSHRKEKKNEILFLSIETVMNDTYVQIEL
jgi:hypothetical protein